MSKDVAVIETDTVSCGSAPSSPKNRVKFLCSHGGKILPRPSDGHLKYVSGETRVISVPRDILFQELMKKLTYSIDGETVLKYQMLSQDLDTLISVKSDEDVCHMFDEIERHETIGIPRLRTFIFPANPIVAENHTIDPRLIDQRYIDALNGIVRPPPLPIKHHLTINTVQHGSLPSSASSSPKSPDSYTNEAINEPGYKNNWLGMHKVQSSPSLCSLNAPQQNNYQNIHQLPPQYYYHLPSPKHAIDHYKNVVTERPSSVRSVGRAEGVRYQVDPTPQYYYSGSNNFMDRRMVHWMESHASSPRGQSATRAWDGTIGG